MIQYCRYCQYFYCSNGEWCDAKQRTVSETTAKSPNKCKLFEFCEIDAYTEGVYKPRPRRKKDYEQLTMEMIERTREQEDMKHILMAFHPKWAALILDGKKTEEIRTRVAGIEPPYIVEMYVTRRDWGMIESRMDLEKQMKKPEGIAPGYVCGRFVCDRIRRINGVEDVTDELSEATQIPRKGLERYAGTNRNCYAMHVESAVPYLIPRKLDEYYSVNKGRYLKNPPQNLVYVERRENKE